MVRVVTAGIAGAKGERRGRSSGRASTRTEARGRPTRLYTQFTRGDHTCGNIIIYIKINRSLNFTKTQDCLTVAQKI